MIPRTNIQKTRLAATAFTAWRATTALFVALTHVGSAVVPAAPLPGHRSLDLRTAVATCKTTGCRRHFSGAMTICSAFDLDTRWLTQQRPINAEIALCHITFPEPMAINAKVHALPTQHANLFFHHFLIDTPRINNHGNACSMTGTAPCFIEWYVTLA